MSCVKVYRQPMTIPTYRLCPDDPNPLFDARLNPYPYTLQNFLSNEKKDTEYDTAVVENEYLRLTVIPTLGGRLYSAYDKVNGREVFYRNKVIKPRLLAARGAWFSGGMEFNFPVSHSPTTMDRVNTCLKEYEDGSASIFFGNIELISRMNWKVELKLYPGKAYIEENVWLYNPTPVENRFYFWTNAAVEYHESVELIYPFDWCINCLESRYIKWPYYKGVDYRKAANVPFSYETFGKLPTGNFFGVYHHEKNCGIVHYADRKKTKGAKFFSWGNDGMADAWSKALTDDGSRYLEIQSGPFESQGVFKFLKPYQHLLWSEYWYPVSNTGGFKHAERELAVNFRAEGRRLFFTFYPTENLPGCSVVLLTGDERLHARKDFKACRAETVFFEPKEDGGRGIPFKLVVLHAGRHILEMEDREPFDPEYPDEDLYEDSRTKRKEDENQSLFNQARYHESTGNFEKAFLLYRENLDRDPNCAPALLGLGQLYLRKSLPTEAEECFKKVLRENHFNSEARFYLAVAEKEKGDEKKAERLMEDIAADAEYYSASVLELAKLYISGGYYRQAGILLWDHSGQDVPYSSFLMSICCRKTGDRGSCISLLEKNTSCSEYIMAERFLSGLFPGESGDLKRYAEGDERVLSVLALEYMRMNLPDEARTILEQVENPGIRSRIILIGAGRETDMQDEQTGGWIADVEPDYVFIQEKEMARILEKERYKDVSGKMDYLLGTYYYSAGRKDDSLRLLLASYEKGLRYTVLLLELAYIYYHYIRDMEYAERYLWEDIALHGSLNAKSLILLDTILKKKGDALSRKKLAPYMEQTPNKSMVVLQLADLYMDTGEEEKALRLLETEECQNWEGGENSGLVYQNVITGLAMKEKRKGNYQKAREYMDRADQYPAGLNYGDSLRMPLSRLHYYRGMLKVLTGEDKAAADEFAKGAFELEEDAKEHSEESREYCMLCLKELRKGGR